jgi:hypothetical protein
MYPSFLIIAFYLLSGTVLTGTYQGFAGEDIASLQVYEDSTFYYTLKKETPYAYTEGTWKVRKDTLILQSIPCKEPEKIGKPGEPITKYLQFEQKKFLIKKSSLLPLNKQLKPIREEQLDWTN